MNFQNYIVVFAIGAAIGFLACLKACNHETTTTKQVTVHVIDSTKLPPVHDTLPTKTKVITVQGDGVHDTIYAAVDIQHFIDSALAVHHIKRIEICGDTIERGDTIHACATLPDQRMTLDIRFAPRVHDTTVTVFPTHSVPFFSWHPIAGIEWNNGYAVAGGVAGSVWILEGAAVLSIGATVTPRLSVMMRF